MRTRRSPINQERLFKMLSVKKEKVDPVTAKCCFNCSHYYGVRNRGECVPIGRNVMGHMKRSCFEIRKGIR